MMNKRGITNYGMYILIVFAIYTSSTFAHTSLGVNEKEPFQEVYDTSNVDGTIIWTFNTTEKLQTSSNIDRYGNIYFATYNESEGTTNLCAVDTSGELKWKTPVPRDLAITHAIGSDGNIYISSAEGYHTVDMDGNVIRTSEVIPPYPTITNHLPLEDCIIVAHTSFIEDGALYAIDYQDNLLWEYVIPISPEGVESFEHIGTGPFAVMDNEGILYFCTDVYNLTTGTISANIYAVKQGEELWSTELNSRIYDIVLIGDIICVSCMEGGVYAFDINGEIKWFHETEDINKLIIGTEGEIVITDQGRLMAYSPNTGEDLWSLNIPGYVDFSLVINICSGGMIYIISKQDEIVSESEETSIILHLQALSSDGTMKWYFEFEIHPTDMYFIDFGSDGTVFLMTSDGILYAFGSEESSSPIIRRIFFVIVILIAIIICLIIMFNRRNHRDKLFKAK